MAKFCTGCGTTLIPGNAFCEECGKPVAGVSPTVVPAATSSRPAAAPGLKPKTLAWIGGGAAAVLILGGGAAFFLLRTPEPPSATELAALLNAQPEFIRSSICLNEMNFSNREIFVNAYDDRTNAVMTLLAGDNLYSPPERIVTSNGWFQQERIRYTRTADGDKAIKGTMLCFADGLEGKSIDYAPVKEESTPPVRLATWKAGYRNAAAWTRQPQAASVLPGRFKQPEVTMDVRLVLQDNKWIVVTPSVEKQLLETLMKGKLPLNFER